MTGGPQSVLFVCGENALRSPMAEAMLKRRMGNRVYVDSVGVRDGALDPMAVEVMAEDGLDISHHQPKKLEHLMDTSFDLIVTLSPEAHHRALDLTRSWAAEVVYWNTPDPSVVEGNRDTRLDAYRELRETLKARIDALFAD
jgi:protein-tyrosine-phosphatase